MGYTHYWRFHTIKMETEPLRQTFKLVSEEIKSLLNELQDTTEIKGGLGEGEPIINDSEIWFNGDASQGQDHETFCISWKETEPFGFCKTARKPYDFFVCLCLLSFHHHFPRNIFQLSSDGSSEEWQEAVDFYNERTQNSFPNPFQEEVTA